MIYKNKKIKKIKRTTETIFHYSKKSFLARRQRVPIIESSESIISPFISLF